MVGTDDIVEIPLVLLTGLNAAKPPSILNGALALIAAPEGEPAGGVVVDTLLVLLPGLRIVKAPPRLNGALAFKVPPPVLVVVMPLALLAGLTVAKPPSRLNGALDLIAAPEGDPAGGVVVEIPLAFAAAAAIANAPSKFNEPLLGIVDAVETEIGFEPVAGPVDISKALLAPGSLVNSILYLEASTITTLALSPSIASNF